LQVAEAEFPPSLHSPSLAPDTQDPLPVPVEILNVLPVHTSLPTARVGRGGGALSSVDADIGVESAVDVVDASWLVLVGRSPAMACAVVPATRTKIAQRRTGMKCMSGLP
jgi:hypothetical protein